MLLQIRRWPLSAALLAVCVLTSQASSAAPSVESPLKEGQLQRFASPERDVSDPLQRGFDQQTLGFKPLRGLSPWPINPADPVSTLPSEAKMKGKVLEFGYLLMDLTAEADTSFDQGEYARAAKFYTAIAKITPTKSVGFVQLCASYVALNDFSKALAACRLALSREGVRPLDYARAVALWLAVKKQLSKADLRELDAVFSHVKAQNVDYLPLKTLRCDLAVRLEDEARLRDCLKPLVESAPEDPRTLTYQWTLSLLTKDWASARASVERAQKAGVPAEAISHMQRVTRTIEREPPKTGGKGSLWLGGVTAGTLGVAACALFWFHRRRMRAATVA